jgi:hypothetical protein
MYSSFFLEHNNSITLTYFNVPYSSPFSVIIYRCADPYCEKCTYSHASRMNGNHVCTLCFPKWTLLPSSPLCQPLCGDGKVVGNETCDDGGKGGCKRDCSGGNQNFICSGGDSDHPSICSSTSLQEIKSSSQVFGNILIGI